mmetsp:Transcript_4513/g.17134  ORF Transcript_4513/g.17134 Transcript_4513/m.17134 type:complete len:214 (-) Transcript_4513:484-1125(-)
MHRRACSGVRRRACGGVRRADGMGGSVGQVRNWRLPPQRCRARRLKQRLVGPRSRTRQRRVAPAARARQPRVGGAWPSAVWRPSPGLLLLLLRQPLVLLLLDMWRLLVPLLRLLLSCVVHARIHQGATPSGVGGAVGRAVGRAIGRAVGMVVVACGRWQRGARGGAGRTGAAASRLHEVPGGEEGVHPCLCPSSWSGMQLEGSVASPQQETLA